MKRFNRNKKSLGVLVIIFCVAAALLTVDRAQPTFLENTFGFIIVPLQSFNTSAADWFEDKADYFKDECEKRENQQASTTDESIINGILNKKTRIEKAEDIFFSFEYHK